VKTLQIALLTLAGLLSPAVLAAKDITIQALHKQMPKTVVDKIDCSSASGLCEIQSGANVFYSDKAAHFLFIGHVYDLDKHVDLTEQRLATLKGVVGAKDPGDGTAVSAPVKTQIERMSLQGLSLAGAVVSGNPSAPTVSVFTDYHCPYCRAVMHELETLNVRVVEYPISILGSRAVAEQVICSPDRAAAMRNAYAGVPITGKTCDIRGLDANEAFARLHHMTETPVLVRADGAVLHGYRPHDALEAWLSGKPQ
jgi:thiol:disulfide interchange protein DsbC